MDEEDRVTPVGLFNYAHSYVSCADVLRRTTVEATHPDSPTRFLYYHAIELYLKSFLRANGVSVKHLKTKYGHNIKKLAAKSEEFGLTVRGAFFEGIIERMSDTDNIFWARYLTTGSRQVTKLDWLHQYCDLLHHQIGEKAYEGSGVTRIPIFPALS